MKRILIDTDVILDFFFDRKPFSDNAAKVLALCESKKITGHITSMIISNVYYLLRQTAKHEKVTDKLNQLISITEVLTTDKETILRALNSPFKDFEDALQNYSAEIIGDIDVIVTRNTKDFKNSALGVMTPESYLKLIIANH
ncbi:MAG: PIN domain-containing protein [Lunatimonas sp.]|uniref:type II toxin-antitoxin system VapC family toxin n=1 Tax=Lunatimonas sp. TaxID=2060141 RepID=UPI00263AA0EC|nr:PIN domain-containing protein [Lunatimonas sp.]MCC5936231.1 PIN domain-containing protein [Lunatimonas sp.]